MVKGVLLLSSGGIPLSLVSYRMLFCVFASSLESLGALIVMLATIRGLVAVSRHIACGAAKFASFLTVSILKLTAVVQRLHLSLELSIESS